MKSLLILFLFCMLATAGIAQREGHQFTPVKDGIASYYHNKFEGRFTANGEVFDNRKFTAASNSLRLGTYVKVTNHSNGKVVYVKINDRMAKTNTRVIDLAHVAAKKLGFVRKGITKVTVEVVTEEEGRTGILAQSDNHPIAGSNEL